MRIEPFTADDVEDVQAVVRLQNAASAQDSPWEHPSTVGMLQGFMRHGWDGEVPAYYLLRDDDAVVAWGSIWTSEWDNTDLAGVDVAVAPDDRRQGLGSAFLADLLDQVRASGRTKVMADAWDNPAGRGFAQAHGFIRGSQAINRRQVLASIDRNLVRGRAEEAAAAASAYELVRLEGRTPESLRDDVAVMTAAINDAPTDDLDIEDELFPPQRLKAYEDAQLARGQRLYRLVARHRESGVLAGHTIVAVETGRPTIGHQHDTSVVREHRGHRLGLLLKTAMVLWLDELEPQLETIDTWNAESNDHMIGVNELLGYQVLGRGLQFQRAL